MRHLQIEVDRKMINGSLTPVFRNYFVCDKKEDTFKNTHGIFTKEERKAAKLNHKNNSHHYATH